VSMVTIGMPAYNNARTIRVAVESLLAQSFTNFLLLISDDCSTDGTEEECVGLAAQDSRIRYFRQPRNLRYGNFRYLLNSASTPYFMWAAADDRWQPAFIESCVQELERHSSLVCAVSRVQYERQGAPVSLAVGTYSLLGEMRENIWRFLSRPWDNCRMYGVFRTKEAQRSFPSQSFHCYDWAFSAATLRFGGHAEIPEVLMVRDRTPTKRYIEMVREDSPSRLGRLFPVSAMTAWLLRDARIPVDRRILGALLALNFEKHVEYVTHFYPTYARAIGPINYVFEQQSWRLRAP
jgi:glycosyltransferase involved in cell wall biosynthesis